MLRNYLIIALRNLVRNKASSFINMSGLAIGMAVAMLIGLWIWDELSFNTSHQNHDQIARVMGQDTWLGTRGTDASNPLPLAAELRAAYGSNFKYVIMSVGAGEQIIASGDKKFTQRGNYMEPEAPHMLTLKMLAGRRGGLTEMNSVLLAESLAKKLFGNADPMDKVVKIKNQLTVKVTGVYKDFPANSEFKDIAFIAPWDLYLSHYAWVKDLQDDWTNNFLQVYVQIAPNTSFENVSASIKDVKLKHVDKEFAKRKPVLFLQPMSRWHLYSTYENGVNVTSEALQFVWFYGIIGLFVLFLACINFMNLSTARSEKRAREVGIRKTMGSARSQLIGQFFSESLLVTFFAFVVSLLVVQLVLPWFNEVSAKKITILWSNPVFWLLCVCFCLITGLIAGSYPALYLSSFQPVKVLKGTFSVGRLAAVPRKALVVIQFTVSVSLIIGTIIVFRQIQFTKNRPVGYNREGLLSISMSSPDLYKNYNALSNELIYSGAITNISRSSGPITEAWSNNSGFTWKGKEPNLQASFVTCPITFDYGKTIGWQFTAGRAFSAAFSTDSMGIVLNEKAVEFMGLQKPIDEIITWDNKPFKIIGVIKDLVMDSPYEPVKPTIFFIDYNNTYIINLRVNPAISSNDALANIETVFKKYNPAAPFSYKFVDEEYARKFAAEERTSKLASCFAGLAIFISCLGLFGLASFTAEQRTKEIGVRKVLGATVVDVWLLLSKDFVRLVLISLLIAAPIAYLFMHNWLQQYAYRSEITPWIFAVTGIGALLITLLTVSYQSFKAAFMNPVKSLRSE